MEVRNKALTLHCDNYDIIFSSVKFKFVRDNRAFIKLMTKIINLISFHDKDAVLKVESRRSANASAEFSEAVGETSGQLYAYRVNSSAVYLGTRNAAELGASIGIGVNGGGTYVCVAQNGNADKNVTIVVEVLCKYLN